MEQTEKKWLTAMAGLSKGDAKKAWELRQAWLELENYADWHGKAMLMESQEIAQIILNKHPEWSSEIVRVGR